MSNKLRRCKVRKFINGLQEREGWFHGFFQYASGDEHNEAGPLALVEYDDGKIEEEPASRLTMLDPPEEVKAAPEGCP